MRKQQHNSRRHAPFLFRGHNILIDHDLGTIGKIAELRLPDHQSIGPFEAIPVFKAQHGVFRERTIKNREPLLFWFEMIEAYVSEPRLDIYECKVTMRECAPHYILTGQPYRCSLSQESGESQ